MNAHPTLQDFLKPIQDAHPEFLGVKSSLLRDLQAMALVASGEIPGSTTPIEDNPFGMSPAQLVLPQSHREEVDLFRRISTRLVVEAGRISPEEFRMILRLLPTFFPQILPPPTTQVTP